MIIFLSGPNDYLRRHRRRFYLEAFRKKHGVIAAERFDLGEEGDTMRFQEFARSVSMFQSAKLALLENVFENESDNLIAELERFCETDATTTILISETKAAPKTFKFLQKAAVVEEFPDISSGVAWDDFVRQEARARNVHLSAEAGRFLADCYQGDAWRLVTELEKLSFLEKPLIHQADLNGLGLEAAPVFWSLVSDLRSPSRAARLASLDRLLSTNEPAARVFSTVAYQWTDHLDLFAAADVRIKTGRYEFEEALLEAALS